LYKSTDKKSIATQRKTLCDSQGDISLTALLETEEFQTVINGCRAFRDRIYTPLVTLFLLIKPVLNPDKSCKKAIADFLAEDISAGKEREISTNTGPYCKARQRLPEEILQT